MNLNDEKSLPAGRSEGGCPLNIIKGGGAVVEDETQLSRLLNDFSAVEGKKVLVHGGGRRATKVAASLGIETKMASHRCRYARSGDNGIWRTREQESGG